MDIGAQIGGLTQFPPSPKSALHRRMAADPFKPFLQMLVHHTIKPVDLIGIAINGVRDFIRTSARTAIRLLRPGPGQIFGKIFLSCYQDIAGSHRTQRPKSVCRQAHPDRQSRACGYSENFSERRPELPAFADIDRDNGVGKFLV